jgi:lysophospholipase L1-like esterase
VYFGKAVGGSSIAGGPADNTLEARFAADVLDKPAVVTILIGANDLASGQLGPDDGAAAWLEKLWTYVAKWKATGARVAVGTVLPQCLPGGNAAHTARRPIVNAAIRAAVGTKIDAVIDYAADPVMGPDSAACDTALYYDGLHPTDGGANGVGGQGKLALVYTPVVDALLVP